MAGETRARCDRAREWASLRTDGELSELESLMLERHLRVCTPCREWEAGLRRATELLRGAPLEVPSRQLELPVRRAGFTTRRVLLAAAVVTVAALASLLGAALSDRGGAPPEPPSPQFSLLPRDAPQLRRPPGARPVDKRPGPEDAV